MAIITGLISQTAGIIDIPVDLRLSERHTVASTPTQIPIEDGTVITDHIILEPISLVVDVEISNFDFAFTHGVNASNSWAQFRQALRERDLYSVFTRHDLYQNMALTELSGENTAPFSGRLLASLTFTEINQASLLPAAFAPVQADAGTAQGQAQPQENGGTNQSITEANDSRNSLPIVIENLRNNFNLSDLFGGGS